MRILAKGLPAIPETEGVRASERKVSEKSEWGEDYGADARDGKA